jgi:hypothetical protein
MHDRLLTACGSPQAVHERAARMLFFIEKVRTMKAAFAAVPLPFHSTITNYTFAFFFVF